MESDQEEVNRQAPLPCWLALAREAEEGEGRGAQAGADGPTATLIAFVLLTLIIVVLLVLAVISGFDAWKNGSPCALWLLAAQLPCLWVGCQAFSMALAGPSNFTWRGTVASRWPNILLGGRRVLCYGEVQVRDVGLYHTEERTWPWQLWERAEFIGESQGFLIVRLWEPPAGPLLSKHSCRSVSLPIHFRHVPPDAVPPIGWRTRLRNRIRRLTRTQVAQAVSPVATFLLLLAAWRTVGWRSDTQAVGYVFALHLLWLGYVIFERGKRSTDGPALPFGMEPHLYLVFDSRTITARDVLRRLSQHVPITETVC